MRWCPHWCCLCLLCHDDMTIFSIDAVLLTEVVGPALPPARPLVAGGRVAAGELRQLGLRLVREEELEQLK